MFGFGKKKIQQEELLAVVDGTVIPIEEVADAAFSEKMLGDGFAIKSEGDTIYACSDATVSVLFPSNHAMGLTLENGVELLIHVGIDTVNENGKGFMCLTELNKQVKRGEPLLKIDRTYLEGKGYDLTTMVIFTNAESYKEFSLADERTVKGGKSVAVRYTPVN